MPEKISEKNKIIIIKKIKWEFFPILCSILFYFIFKSIMFKLLFVILKK